MNDLVPPPTDKIRVSFAWPSPPQWISLAASAFMTGALGWAAAHNLAPGETAAQLLAGAGMAGLRAAWDAFHLYSAKPGSGP